MSPSPPPPTKANLKAWWNQFKFMQRMKPPGQKDLPPGYGYGYGKGIDDSPHPVFGAPLHESLEYASVQVSTANSNGELYIWGDIPVVVAKCGLYLKENATEVEGTFRVSGSTKRMRDLQALFETPPKYGRNLDWKKETYTSHDVASVFRRYLTQMPEPVIPYNLYTKFREALSKKQSTDDVIKTYKQLIRSMPRQNQYLLLYVLDLLSVFARKAEKNLMTATNLAVIFRPGLINHPQHELAPKEHQLSQEALEFLIEHQDWFMLDVPPPPPPPKSPHTALSPAPIENEPTAYDYSGERSVSPGPTVMSALGEPGWRLVEKSDAGPRAHSRHSGRRRSSSASGEPTGHGHTTTGTGSHIRIASAGRAREVSVSSSNGSGSGLGVGIGGAGAVGVTRSRTLPSRRTAGRDAGGSEGGVRKEGLGREATTREGVRERREGREGREGRNVLKKQKRASMQTQRSTQQVPQPLAAPGGGVGVGGGGPS
ncbi:Rho GTPase activation protein [Phellopilus nigrolimitatus]|nr:Rho GTPase activation protein [Phellopilus nigrolimitatus]